MGKKNTGCPGAAMRQWDANQEVSSSESTGDKKPVPSALAQWPIQLMLVPPNAPYFKDADLAITADCIPFAYADYHNDFLKGRPIVIACPKLDNLDYYIEKLTEIFKDNSLKSVEVLIMEVPCCGGLAQAALIARNRAAVDLPIRITTIGVRGENFGTKVE
ncbi:MAG: iron-sulfur cluster-binding oxidoreductase [Candidatus Zixiibacteriota bacterium]